MGRILQIFGLDGLDYSSRADELMLLKSQESRWVLVPPPA